MNKYVKEIYAEVLLKGRKLWQEDCFIGVGIEIRWVLDLGYIRYPMV